MGKIEKRLQELKIALPEAPAPVASYVSVTRVGNLVVTSGQLPWQDGRLVHEGKLGVEVSDEQGYETARRCAINALAQLKQAVGELDKIKKIFRVEGYLHCGPGYRNHPQVLNGASDLFQEVFGDAGKHTRIALGIHEMPLNSPVQLAVWAEVVDEGSAQK